ncbi:ZIP zinc transporter-domain-containing protein [Bisporella sp. PMI_857]|nr:ZIP zinc transporter-domain-containing protein [Bisporella sp. PMI_857]
MGLIILVVVSVVMALSCFLAGALPLSMTLSSSQLRLISTIGMGVLVGTSLIVIIPEGIEAVYSADTGGHSHARRSLRARVHAAEVQWPSSRVNAIVERVKLESHAGSEVVERSVEALDFASKLERRKTTIFVREDPATPPPKDAEGEKDKVEPATPPENEADHHEQEPPTFYIGLSLILGFILMFLIDKLPRHASENFQSAPAPRHISLDNLSQGLHSSIPSNDDIESESFLQSLTPSPKQTRSLATTIGLVIHAFADGIAMGASASSSDKSLGFIIFLAIMVHKAPAAFGLTSVLLKQGLSKRAARGHLIVFSLASPFGALSTWLLVGLLGGKHMEGPAGQWWTGMLLLFSAGTFLYVAMHAMQDDSGHNEHSTNGYTDGTASQRKQSKPQVRDTIAAVCGMLIPLLTQYGHHH